MLFFGNGEKGKKKPQSTRMLGCLKAEKWISSFQTQELIFRKEICLFSHLPLHNKKRIFYVSKHWHMYYTLLLIPTPLLFPTHLVQLSTLFHMGVHFLSREFFRKHVFPKARAAHLRKLQKSKYTIKASMRALQEPPCQACF